jgi:hypothetical protein
MNGQCFTRSLRINFSQISLFLFGHFLFGPGAARTQYLASDALLLSAFALSLYCWSTHKHTVAPAQHTLAHHTTHTVARHTTHTVAHRTTHTVARRTTHTVSRRTTHTVARRTTHTVARRTTHTVARRTTHTPARHGQSPPFCLRSLVLLDHPHCLCLSKPQLCRAEVVSKRLCGFQRCKGLPTRHNILKQKTQVSFTH